MKYCFVILLFIGSITYAGIGDTKSAIIGKYGEPTSKKANVLSFVKNGMTIKAYIIGTICERVDFTLKTSTESAVKKILKDFGTFTISSYDEKTSSALYIDKTTKNKARWYTKKKYLSIFSPKMDR